MRSKGSDQPPASRCHVGHIAEDASRLPRTYAQRRSLLGEQATTWEAAPAAGIPELGNGVETAPGVHTAVLSAVSFVFSVWERTGSSRSGWGLCPQTGSQGTCCSSAWSSAWLPLEPGRVQRGWVRVIVALSALPTAWMRRKSCVRAAMSSSSAVCSRSISRSMRRALRRPARSSPDWDLAVPARGTVGLPARGLLPSDAIDGPDGDLERPVGQLSFSGSLDGDRQAGRR